MFVCKLPTRIPFGPPPPLEEFDDPADNVRKPITRYTLTPEELARLAQKKKPPVDDENAIELLRFCNDCTKVLLEHKEWTRVVESQTYCDSLAPQENVY